MMHHKYAWEDYRGSKILVGEITPKTLWKNFPGWKSDYDQYRADQELVNKISKISDHYRVICVMGVWCPDSRVGVPPFLKTIDLAKNPNIDIQIYAVDRQKKDPYHYAEKFKVDRVPTFVIFSGRQEIGRMIEFPEESFESDFLKIIESANARED